MTFKFHEGCCLLILLNILGIEASPEYIYEDCLLNVNLEKKKTLDTMEDQLYLVIGQHNPKPPSLKVKGNGESITIPLPNITSNGLIPIQLDFKETTLLVSADVGNLWRKDENASLKGLSKSIYGENIYLTNNCRQDMPYRTLTETYTEVAFPLSLDREQKFQLFLTKRDIIKFKFGGRELNLCWNEGEKGVFVQNGTEENCNLLPIMVPLRLNFHLNSTSQEVHVTNMNLTSIPYSEKKVTFSATNQEGEVYIVQCLQECPEESTCPGIPLDVSINLLVTFIVLLCIANIISVAVIIYQCMKQRDGTGDPVGQEIENNRDPDVSSDTDYEESSFSLPVTSSSVNI